MPSETLVASALTILPGMALLWWLLGRFEGYFEDRRVFFSLIVGFFAGILIAGIEANLFRFDSLQFQHDAGASSAFTFFLVGYAFIQSAAKAVVLGSKKFRGRKDTPYYGAGLGIGFGATWMLLYVGLAIHGLNVLRDGLTPAWRSLVVLLAVALGGIAQQGAAGVFTGIATAEGKLWRGVRNGLLIHVPFLLIFWFFLQEVHRGGLQVLMAGLVLVYGLGVAIWAQRTLDKIVPQELRDLVRRDNRRKRRKGDEA